MMKKAFLASLCVHGLVIALALYLIKKPYEVEVVTIPLCMSTAFETSSQSEPIQEPNDTPAKPQESHVSDAVESQTPKSPVEEEKPKEVVHTKVISSPKKPTPVKAPMPSKSSELSDTAEVPVQTEAIASSEETPSTTASASSHDGLAQGGASSSASPKSANAEAMDPSMRANFNIIRKKTYERLYYPKASQNALQEGTATLIFKLSASGTVEDIELEHSTGYTELDKIVLKAARSLQGEKLQSLGKRINIRLSVEFVVPNKAA
jgi:TonB family protein